MKKLFPSFVFLILMIFQGCGQKPEITIPTQEQINWADCEIGVIFHFEIPTFNPDYDIWTRSIDGAKYFNPSDLSTDQWMEVSKNIDAKYAILVAKHCTGFSLWPTEVHEFSVKNSPWKDGKGDLVKDFISSCNKYSIKPGIYASTFCNGFLNINFLKPRDESGPCTLEQYNRIVEKQLSELWGNYGPLFEIWFDGGVLSQKDGGPDILSIIEEKQPQAITFGSPFGYPNRIRWVGNEKGFSPDTCWATSDIRSEEGSAGDPYSKNWCPGEADFTLRFNETYQGGWFWHEGDDDKIFSVEELVEKYENSVGHNTNMLLGVVIDDRGRIPDADARRIKEFGEAIRAKYGHPLISTSGNSRSICLELDGETSIDRAIIQEDISYGERVLSYRLEGKVGGDWKTLFEGANIGHKRIIKFQSDRYEKIRIKITEDKDTPHIRNFEVFETM